MSEPKLNIKEESSTKKTRSPPKKAKVEQTVPKKKKLKTDADKAAEKAQHLRFGKAELTPDELSRLSKAQKREMYAAHAARSAVHHEVDQYEDENVGVQALSEGEKAAGNVRDISKSRYARKLKKKAKMQGFFCGLFCIGFQLFLFGHRLLHLGSFRGRTGLFGGRFLFDVQFRLAHFCPSETSPNLVVIMR